jgi:phage terminase large subunit GpA-like protein
MTRRLSTSAFAGRTAAHLDPAAEAKIRDAFDRAQIVDIAATLDGPRPLKAMLIAPYQVFKSLLGQLHLARNAVVRPAKSLWYHPSTDDVKTFAEDKLNPIFDNHPVLRALTYAARSAATKLRRSLAGGFTLQLLSFKTESHRHSRSASDIYIDEVHQMDEPGALDQISARRGDFEKEYLEFLMSTGLTAGTDAEKRWATTDQRTWFVRCPACHRLHEPRFAHYADDGETIIAGIRYEKHYLPDGQPDEAAIAPTLHYDCPRCHARLPDTDATRRAWSGTRSAPRGLYVMQNSRAYAHSAGWTFHGLTVRSWLGIVLRFERAHLARRRGDLEPLAKCIREEFGGIFDPELYLRRKVTRPIAPYKMGADWPLEAITNPNGSRFATIDLQQDYYVLTIRMWGRGSASRLRWCALPKSVTEINELLSTHHVEKRHVYLDSRHDSQRARRLAAMMGWNTMQGDGRTEGTAPKSYLHADGLRRIYDEEAKILDAHIGTIHEGEGANVHEWLFSKQSALDRLHLLRTETYVPDLTRPEYTEPLHACPEDTPDWYWQQAFRHYRKTTTDKAGQPVHTWYSPGNDHAEDTEAMGVVVATMARLTGAETLPDESNEKPA